MFIRTGVQKCQPFPTHSTTLFPKYDTNSGKINLIGSWPTAAPNDHEDLISMIHDHYIGGQVKRKPMS